MKKTTQALRTSAATIGDNGADKARAAFLITLDRLREDMRTNAEASALREFDMGWNWRVAAENKFFVDDKGKGVDKSADNTLTAYIKRVRPNAPGDFASRLRSFMFEEVRARVKDYKLWLEILATVPREDRAGRTALQCAHTFNVKVQADVVAKKTFKIDEAYIRAALPKTKTDAQKKADAKKAKAPPRSQEAKSAAEKRLVKKLLAAANEFGTLKLMVDPDIHEILTLLLAYEAKQK
jgi:pyruvate/2-oxoglutarate dehydrogenase complex dihydrolipoamide acyltransferase (E2) component